MDEHVRVEAMALIERLSPKDMPVIAAAVLDAWCAMTGASHESIVAFVGHVIEAEGDYITRHVLIGMLADMRAVSRSEN